MTRIVLILAGLSALAAAPALAQSAAVPTVPVPVRTQGFVFVAPDGPTVLESDPQGHAEAPVNRPDLAVPSVPVASVMNGGAFGYTGFEYFNDQISEGRFGARKRPKEYVIAPSFVVAPRN